VVFGLWNGSIQVFDSVNNRVINTLSTAYGKHKEAVNCIQFSPSKVVSGSYDCSIKVWEQENPKTLDAENLKKLLAPSAPAINTSPRIAVTQVESVQKQRNPRWREVLRQKKEKNKGNPLGKGRRSK